VHFTEMVVDVLYVRAVPPATIFVGNIKGEALMLEHVPALAVAGTIAAAAASIDMRYNTPRHMK
jgi:hypothetical protein